MPNDKAKLQKLNDMMDSWLEQRKQDRLAGIDDDDDDENTDPIQFQEPPHKGPIAEPPEQYADSLSKRRDLFR
jgi:hypothetical protein